MQPELCAHAVGRRTIDVEYYRPAGRGPWPAVLLLHEMFGLTSQVRADARHLAREGYLVMAPNLYTDGMRRYCMKFVFGSLRNSETSDQLGELHRLLDILKASPDCNGKLGVIGMCLTGGFVLQLARRDDVAAPVVYHHATSVRGSGLTDPEAAEIHGVVQGHFAADDPICPRSKIEALGKQLGGKLDAHVYDGVGHGLRSQFRHTSQSAEAWDRTLAFFREQLA